MTTEEADNSKSVRHEEPCLEVQDFAVAIHMAATELENNRGGGQRQNRIALQRFYADFSGPSDESIPELPSYERDMLSYAYRDTAPFYTTTLTSLEKPGAGSLGVGFPIKGTWYRSEKDNLRSVSERSPRRAVSLHAAITDFVASPISILHVVLRPWGEPSDSSNSMETTLDEYDLIKLIKLWEGGEGQPVPGSKTEKDKAKEQQIPHFFLHGDGPLSLDELFIAVFKEEGNFSLCKHAIGSSPPKGQAPQATESAPEELATRVGTVELVLAPGEETAQPHWFFEEIRSIRKSRGAFEEKWRFVDRADEGWLRRVAVGGVVQGLLDFDEISPAELADVFAGFAKDGRCIYEEGVSITGFHKGTLLQIRAGRPKNGVDGKLDAENREWPVGVSPYLMVPQAVLLYNDELLRESAKYSAAVMRDSRLRDRLFNPESRIKRVQELVGRQRTVLSHLSLNVFNYPAERTLFSAGQEVRGLDDRFGEIQQRLAGDSLQLDTRIRRRDTYSAVTGIGLPVAAAFGITGGGHTHFASWAGPVLAGLLALAYFVLRAVS
jgi:hypothetical protein